MQLDYTRAQQIIKNSTILFNEEQLNQVIDNLAKKIDASVRKDLHQQLQYYISLADNSVSEENIASNALALLKNQSSDLGDKQAPFANDILSSYQLLNQLDTWQKEFQ